MLSSILKSSIPTSTCPRPMLNNKLHRVFKFKQIHWGPKNMNNLAPNILTLILMLSLCVAFPETIMHYLLVLMHALYEGITYVVEEILIFTFNLSKLHSQLIVFYLSWCVGLYGFYKLCWQLPAIANHVKHRLFDQYTFIRNQSIQAWQHLSLGQKVKLLLIPLVGALSVFALLFV